MHNIGDPVSLATLRTLAAALVLAAASTRIPAASFPPDAAVLYSRVGSPDGRTEIVTGDGRAPTLVAIGEWPVFSAQNGKILLHRDRVPFARANVYAFDLPSGEVRLIYTDNDYVVGVDWLPGGDRVVFDYACGIYSVGADGTGVAGFVGGADCYDDAPSVNPVDGRLVFHNVNQSLKLADANGGNRRAIPNTTGQYVWPVWSPDGTRIAAWRGNALVTLKDDGTGIVDLGAAAGVAAVASDGRVAWSPDGQWVVAATSIGSTNGLWAFSTTDSTVTRIPTPPGADITWVGTVQPAGVIPDWTAPALSIASDRYLVNPGEAVEVVITAGNTGLAAIPDLALTVDLPEGAVVAGSSSTLGTIEAVGRQLKVGPVALPAAAQGRVAVTLKLGAVGEYAVAATLAPVAKSFSTKPRTAILRARVPDLPPDLREGALYSRVENGLHSVWFAPSDGRPHFKVLDGGRARLSWDGTAIAFLREGDIDASRASVWVRELASGKETKVFPNGDYVVGLAWTADNSRVLFDYSCGIASVNRDGTGYRGEAAHDCFDDAPDVRPGDGLVVFHNAHQGLLFDNLPGAGIQLVPGTIPGDFWPRWSPDGRSILFVHGRDLWTIQPDGTARTRLTTLPGRKDSFENGGTWTWDGRLIVVAGTVQGRSGLYAVDPSGGGGVAYLGPVGEASPRLASAYAGSIAPRTVLRMEPVFLLAPEPHRVAVFGRPGQGYVVERTEPFDGWLPIHTNVISLNWFGYTDDATSLKYRFYRAEERP